VGDKDISPGSSFIKEQLLEPGVMLSVRNLLGLTLRVSDNTASDILLRLVGGARTVTDYLHALGLTEIRIDRSLKSLLADFYGVVGLPGEEEWSIQKYRTCYQATSEAAKAGAQHAFADDRRDSCTPHAIGSFLASLPRGQLLQPAHTSLLLNYLRASPNSPGRIKGLLPPDIVVAHKGGTLANRIVNDVGLVRLPEARGELVVALFVIASGRPVAEHERTIAHLARALYDYFLFRP
jgi:beta-lactamase class A